MRDNDWQEFKLSELATFRRGSFPQPYGLDKWYDDENGYPFIQVYDVSDNMKLKETTKRRISDLAAKQSVFIPKGTLILTIQGSIGRIAITHYDAYMDRTLLVFQSFLKPTDKRFFMYVVYRLFEVEKEKAHGSTIKTITKEQLSSFTIPLPPLPEQQKIAEILSTVDAKIEIIDQQITETQELKKGLMQQLLTGKLSVIENRLLSEAEMKDSSLGKIPKSWEVVKLSNVTSKIGDGIHSTPKYVKDSDYHFVNGNNLINGQLTIFQKTKCVSKSEYERLKIDLKENSVLMSINGTIGNLAFYKNEKVVFGKSAAFITSDDSKLNYKFLYFYLQTSFLIKYYSNELTGTTIKNLSLKSIRNTPIFIPSLQEQNKISTILSTMDEKLEVLIEKKTNYQDLKQGLMQQLLTGKIRIQPALEA